MDDLLEIRLEICEEMEKRLEVVVMPWWAPGWGWGRGWGWRWWFWATGMPGWMRWAYFAPWAYPPAPRPEEELEMLEDMKRELEAELEDIKKRIEELKKELGKQ